MACILNIETSTAVCSVAVSLDGNNVYKKEEINGPSHATLLGVFANDAITYIRKNDMKLDAIGISCGPGSYTGLRIGVSEAKGLCYGLNVPLIAVNTLLIMASKIANSSLFIEDALLCPMIDARRMEVYAAIYNRDLKLVRDIQADIVDEHSYSQFLKQHKILFFGNGADKCKNALSHPHALFLENIYPTAADMSVLSEAAFQKQQFEDIAYFEPFYLKEFVATIPKNKIF